VVHLVSFLWQVMVVVRVEEGQEVAGVAFAAQSQLAVSGQSGKGSLVDPAVLAELSLVSMPLRRCGRRCPGLQIQVRRFPFPMVEN
jgi:hypothetical protein